MKKLKLLFAVVLVVAMSFSIFTGCSVKEAEEDVEQVEEKVGEDVEEVEEKVADDVEQVEENVEEDVEEVEEAAEDEFEKLEGDVEEIITAAKDEFSKWETEAKNFIESGEEVAEEDIHEAIDYIDEHIAEPFENGEVTKKITSYAAKLKYLGEKDASIAEHEIAKLGQNVYDYMKKIIVEGEDLESEAVTAIKTDIDKGLATIKADKDRLVSEFKSLF